MIDLRVPTFLLAMAVALHVPAAAQLVPTRGLIVRIDHDARSVVLETSAGAAVLSITSDVVIVDHAARPVAFRELQPGDAIAYRGRPDRVTHVTVARSFWARPPDD
jgi:hypothetical protein